MLKSQQALVQLMQFPQIVLRYGDEWWLLLGENVLSSGTAMAPRWRHLTASFLKCYDILEYLVGLWRPYTSRLKTTRHMVIIWSILVTNFLHWWCFSHFGDIFLNFWILFFLIGDKSRQNGYRFPYFGDYFQENGDNQHYGA